MVHRTINTGPPPIEVREFTSNTIEKGLKKLRHRIGELKGLDPSQLMYDDPCVDNIVFDITECVRDVFGTKSTEFQRNEDNRGFENPNILLKDALVQENFIKWIPKTVTMLEGFIKRLDEMRVDLDVEEPPGTGINSSGTLETCKSYCPKCGEDSNADIVACHENQQYADVPDNMVWTRDTYRILRCRGCEWVYVQREHLSSEDEEYDVDSRTGEYVVVIEPHVTYWPPPKKRQRPPWLYRLNDKPLRNLLDEVYGALDADHRVLAAIGARTALDRAFVLMEAHESLGFVEKLQQLRDRDNISEVDMRMLDAWTDVGSAAAHRSWKPEPMALTKIMDGVENFLQRNLVLESDIPAIKDKVPPKKPRPKQLKDSSKSQTGS